MRDTLLVELLTEELPPKSLVRLAAEFSNQMRHSLLEAGFLSPEAAGRDPIFFATPRRLAVRFDDVLDTQPDRVIERKGPAVAAGVDTAGRPTRALEGFMRSAGVTFGALGRIRDGKAEYFVARIEKRGERIDAYLGAMVEAALKKLPVAKLMRWGAGEAQFVRPVHGLVMMHGPRVVPGAVFGHASGNLTRGHRFMSTGDIVLPHAKDYAIVLAAQGKVIASFDERRARIRALLDAAAGEAEWLQDEALLDEVTALVEWPAVYEAGFDEAFLAVPQECLILTMKANQKYFPLMKAGRLTNRFLVVSNMEVADPVNIVAGNARVVRPRLADARFFFEIDKKTPLAEHARRLAGVVYHNRLGSQGSRVERLARLAAVIGRRVGADLARIERAARLAKADLVTGMVGEFPELQGIMGRYYALAGGEPDPVADAIEQHYRPRFAGDRLPEGNIACAVALADKLDALIGMFAIGEVPTGERDPFGLRRAALGVLRILIETPLPLDLGELVAAAASGYPAAIDTGDAVRVRVFDFMLERLRHLLREAGHASEVIEAVLALRPGRVDLVPARLAAVTAFRAAPEADALAAANKRIVNILKKADAVAAGIDVALFQEAAERRLFREMNEISPLVRSLVAAEDYAGALKHLAGLRAAVDAFFDDVLVMAEEPLTRANRLAMLRELAGLMGQIADISRL
ncbi:MAG: glycine--tRNA ligase subunit beta [Betaproteobacteria bacterium CG2_30_68_42]|nr:MAG: glycine--tRNA ligase subunit beta [Betaproteobacteria bacterium CG2_30_68_42]